MSEFEILTVRKLADRSDGTREVRYDPLTGQKKLVNPATPGEDHEPWPLAGVTIEGDPPLRTSAGTRWVDNAIRERWMRRIGETPVVRPGGPPDAPWATSHTFIHADKLVIEDAERGDVVYYVTRNPDKYFTSGDNVGEPVAEYGYTADGELAASEVSWHYELRLEETSG